MAVFIRYLLLANIFLLLLSLFFRLFLSKENWFKTNRMVLMIGIFLSLTIPMIQFDILPSPEKALIVIPELMVHANTIKPDFILGEITIYGTAPKVIPWLSIIEGIYIIGSIIMLLIFINKLTSIKSLQRTHPMKWYNNLFITILPQQFQSFSFLSTVYYPGPLKLENKQTDLILEHERIHIQQKHSWDLICLEVIQLLFFYNPAVYSLRKQLILTHEYIADQAVACTDIKHYTLTLFNSFFNVPNLALSHAFNQSSTLKKRFIMLQKTTKNRWSAYRYMMLVPMIGAFLALSAFTTVSAQEKKTEAVKRTKEEVAKEVVEIKLAEEGFDKKDIQEIQRRIDQINKDVNSSRALELELAKKRMAQLGEEEAESEVFFIVEEMPEFQGKGLENFRYWVQENITYPDLAKQNGISGTVYCQFIVGTGGNVESIKIIRGVDPILDDEVVRVLNTAPAWQAGKQRGKNVKVSMAIPVKFNLN